ncbi:MAG: hypothetical protein ACRCUT_05360 [Spirochaetota bacterium]
MKEKRILISIVLIAALSGCTTAVKQAEPGNGGAVQGEMVYLSFPAVHARRPVPPDTVLRVSIGYYNDDELTAEIAAKDAELKDVIAEFGRSVDVGYVTDISMYNQAHET